MGAAREKGPADFDLERFIDMFDEALTSQDERVVNALRSLMMMVILTKPETRNPMADRVNGPLRQMFDDVNNLTRRMHRLEDEIRALPSQSVQRSYKEEAYRWEDLNKEKEKYRLMQQQTASSFEATLASEYVKRINGGKI
jgi:hypothetical protein